MIDDGETLVGNGASVEVRHAKALRGVLIALLSSNGQKEMGEALLRARIAIMNTAFLDEIDA